MSGRCEPPDGDHTARLFADRVNGSCVCHRYTGAGDRHRVDHDRPVSADEAATWDTRQLSGAGRARTRGVPC